MLLNNRFSKKNNYLYKMKCLNTRNNEYFEDNIDYEKVEKQNMIEKKKKIRDKQ